MNCRASVLFAAFALVASCTTAQNPPDSAISADAATWPDTATLPDAVAMADTALEPDASSDAADAAITDAPADTSSADVPAADQAIDAAARIDAIDSIDATLVADALDTTDATPFDGFDTAPDAGARDGHADALDARDTSLPRVCSSGDVPADMRPGESRYPALAWNGQEYGVAFQSDSDGNLEVYLARLASDGTVISNDRVTDDPANDTTPVIAWDGSRYWLAWSHTSTGGHGDAIRLVTASASDAGVAFGMPTDVTTGAAVSPELPALLALPSDDGDGFAVAWDDARNGTANREVYYAHLDATGARVGAEVRITDAPRVSYGALLSWNSQNAELGLLWLDDRTTTGPDPNEQLYFARVRPDGTRPAPAIDLAVTTSGWRAVWPSIVFDGHGYGVAWANESGVPDVPHIQFAQLAMDGTRRSGSAQVLLSSNPASIGAWTTSIAWNGSEYLVVWEDQRHPNGDLVVRRINANGAPTTPEVFLYNDAMFSAHPSLLWTGSRWAVAWEDNRSSTRDIWFRSLRATDCLGM